MKDSLTVAENRQAIEDAEARYQNDRETAEIELLRKDQEIQATMLQRNRIITAGVGLTFDAIDEALEGGAPMSPSIARMVISSMQSNPKKRNAYDLTPRELEILGCLSKGSSYKLIGSELAISIDTVRTHIKKIYEKLHVHSQTEAVAKAFNERLI